MSISVATAVFVYSSVAQAGQLIAECRLVV
jgi:hypothetical protein